MAGNSGKGSMDDFLEQILGESGGGGGYGGGGGMMNMNMNMNTVLQLVSGGADGGSDGGGGLRGGFGIQGMRSMGMNLEQQGFPDNTAATTTNNDNIIARDSVHMRSLFPTFGDLQTHQSICPTVPPPQFHQSYHSQQPTSGAGVGLHPPSIRPRVRARRGQATDPHSIAERLRRERIAERMKALQELVPSANKTDRAAMLDEIVDYVKFLRLQVKVLSMSRLGGAGVVAQLVADVPLSSVEGIEGGNHEQAWEKWSTDGTEGIEGGNHEQAWEKWSTDGTEQQVANLMEEDVGTAMQFLQSKALCIMPISLASVIFPTCQPDTTQTRMVKSEFDVLS